MDGWIVGQNWFEKIHIKREECLISIVSYNQAVKQYYLVYSVSMRYAVMDNIKIPSMSNIAADSGIHRGIRRIKPYVLNRSGRKPRARELFQARRAQIRTSQISLSPAIYIVLMLRRDVYKTPGIFIAKQCLSLSLSVAHFITFRNVPPNGRKSR